MNQRNSLEKKLQLVRKHGIISVYKKAVVLRVDKSSPLHCDFKLITQRKGLTDSITAFYNLCKNHKPLNANHEKES